MVPQRYGHQGEGGGSRAGGLVAHTLSLVAIGVPRKAARRWRIRGRSESMLLVTNVDVSSRLSLAVPDGSGQVDLR